MGERGSYGAATGQLRGSYTAPASHLAQVENRDGVYEAFWSFAAQTEGVRPPGLKQLKKMMEGLETELAFKTDVTRDARTGLQTTVYRGVSLR